jgi:hypothetical protein
MKTFRIAAGLALAAGLTTLGSLDAAQGNVDGKKFDKGATITLQGCVVAGDKKDTYVLAKVQEWPVGNSAMGKYGRRMYWIDKDAADMKAHMGHTIQVTGKISDVKKSEIEMEDVRKGPGHMVEIEGPGPNVETSARNAGVPAGHGTDDIPLTLLVLKVEELKMISSSCPATR